MAARCRVTSRWKIKMMKRETRKVFAPWLARMTSDLSMSWLYTSASVAST
jgi:hypothetical protein